MPGRAIPPGPAPTPALGISRLSHTSMYMAPLIRCRMVFFCFGSAISSSGIGGGSGAFIFSPVHSRKPPQDPQNASVSWL
jgi:hypothetical protein